MWPHNFEFESPWFFAFFLLFIPLLVLDFKRRKKQGVKVPSLNGMKGNTGVSSVLRFLKWTKYFILSVLIIALARPRTFTVTEERDDNKGVDIMLAVDISFSMLTRDLTPDRLTALQNIATKFVQSRPNDRIGLVAYSGEAFTKVPLTLDHDVVVDELINMKPTDLEPGTAIGEGLAVAVNHIKDSKAKSKIIILITDGVNTIENATPAPMAAEIAKNNNIKVYTIGLGTNGYALMPTHQDVFGDLIFTEAEVKIDEPLLKDIAGITDGRYYRATSNTSLQDIYDEINALEKTEMKTNKSYSYEEYFRLFLWVALGFLLLDALLRWIVYKIVE